MRTKSAKIEWNRHGANREEKHGRPRDAERPRRGASRIGKKPKPKVPALNQKQTRGPRYENILQKIDISDPKQIENFVFECFSGRWKENGFINLLIRYGGMTKEQVLADAEAQDYNRLLPATAGVAAEIARRIRARNLNLRPLRTFQRRDGLSGKLRDLCQATAMQQCMDYVAVGALGELFHAKIGPFQCASIPGRGQGYGKRHLEKWIRRDKQARHVRKGDIKKCYASLTPDKTMELLHRDIHKTRRCCGLWARCWKRTSV